jgi:fumarylacetoacetate (FAA) hydrolase
MKLATYQDGSRDGQLVVVSRDLASAHFATGIATRLQQVLDDWNFLSPQLEDLSATLNGGKTRHAFAFDPARCMAPLPRAYQWVDGSAYPSHVERLCRARGAEVPATLHTAPPVRRGAGDALLGACDEARFADDVAGIDLGAVVAVITGDVETGTSPEQALESVRLVALANDWALRELERAELERGIGHGLVQSRPATAFAPVAVTPDELGDAWTHGRLHLNVDCTCNGKRIGLVDAGGMAFHFGALIAHLTRTRRVRAGSIVGGGTVSSADATRGVACLAERRALEIADHGEPRTGWMRFGDSVRIEVRGRDGLSVFGAIEQTVAPLQVA